jgi:thiamine pyrophosphate-dependent acetolactate synthase large subunit-like protein
MLTIYSVAVGLHANVGLMHAVMAVYNAFCDRVPMLMLGATGPLDATRRRPWIDWLHTATDQAALIRPFIKFDDQPQSPNAAIRSLVQATAMTSSKPCAPAYVCLDLSLQEDAVDPKTLHFPDTQRYLDVHPPGPSTGETAELLSSMQKSKRPLFMFGRMNQSKTCWDNRVRLAERYGAKVVTDLKQACSFPTDHALHAAAPSIFNPPDTSDIIRFADLIVAWDWVDLSGALKAAHDPGVEPSAKIMNITLDSALHNGWSKDHFDLPPADLTIREQMIGKTVSMSEILADPFTHHY